MRHICYIYTACNGVADPVGSGPSLLNPDVTYTVTGMMIKMLSNFQVTKLSNCHSQLNCIFLFQEEQLQNIWSDQHIQQPDPDDLKCWSQPKNVQIHNTV